MHRCNTVALNASQYVLETNQMSAMIITMMPLIGHKMWLKFTTAESTSKHRYCLSLWSDLLNGQVVLHSLYYTSALHPPCYSLRCGFSFCATVKWKWKRIDINNRIEVLFECFEKKIRFCLWLKIILYNAPRRHPRWTTSINFVVLGFNFSVSILMNILINHG